MKPSVFSQQDFNIQLVVAIVFILIIVLLPIPFNRLIDDGTSGFLFKLRGAKNLTDDFIFIYLGDEDIEALGDWPISRDYFGYVTHILTVCNAKVIGFDFLFDSPDKRYPEFDRLMEDFFRTAHSVCLPSTVTEISDKRNCQYVSELPKEIGYAENVIYPFETLKQNAAGIGFSNLDDEAVIYHMPIVMSTPDSFMVSFGVELARLYLNNTSGIKIFPHKLQIYHDSDVYREILLDASGRIRLNHFGNIENVRSIGFLNLLQTFEQSPDSLDFSGKLVLVASTASSLPVLKATPLSRTFPASLIHLTTAENIIFQNSLHSLPLGLRLILIVFVFAITCCSFRFVPFIRLFYLIAGLLFLIFLSGILCFSVFNIILPEFYLVFSCLIAAGSALWGKNRTRQRQAFMETLVFKKQIEEKQMHLETVEKKLVTLEKQLQKEVDEKSDLYQRTKRLAEEKRQAALALEKQIRDLQTFSRPEKAIKRTYGGIVHAPDSPLVSVLKLVDKIGSDTIPVLIQGETGTGKELIARAIHRASDRKRFPFVAVNCGALSETLLESELFGHEKGSFTGAHARRKGRFELANGGTIFLDEIADTSPAFQTRLLRVLQEGTFERVGGEKTLHVDVRVIAASGRDLKDEVGRNQFRSDLFYRLNGFSLQLPPLRERPNDIPLLAEHFIREHEYKSIRFFSDTAMDRMLVYHWPGNVREMQNAVHRAAILARSDHRDMIQVKDLPEEIQKSRPQVSENLVYFSLEEQILNTLRALQFSRSAITQTARALDNRDRGTITEYFRGICFETLVSCNLDIDKTAKQIAATDDHQTILRVRNKIVDYIKNLETGFEINSDFSEKTISVFKGLPQKYHPSLQHILDNLDQIQ